MLIAVVSPLGSIVWTRHTTDLDSIGGSRKLIAEQLATSPGTGTALESRQSGGAQAQCDCQRAARRSSRRTAGGSQTVSDGVVSSRLTAKRTCRAFSTALLCVVALATTSCAGGGPAKVKSNIDIGVNTYYAWPGPITWAKHDMAMLARNDIGFIRQNFRWDQIEPQRGVWRWGFFDTIMEQASANHINVLPTLEYSPKWASGLSNPANPPTNLEDFATFAAAVVSRYGSKGAFWTGHPKLAKEPIDTVEVWNEPWNARFWEHPDPTTYAQMVRLTARAVRAKDPGVKVAASEDAFTENSTDHTRVPWVVALARAFPDQARYVSVASVHVYQQQYLNPTSSYAPKVALVIHELSAIGMHVPIWITETGTSATSLSERGFGAPPRTIVRQAWVQQGTDLLSALDELNRLEPKDQIKRVYEFSYFRSVAATGWDARDKTDSGFYLLGPRGGVRGAGAALFFWTQNHEQPSQRGSAG